MIKRRILNICIKNIYEKKEWKLMRKIANIWLWSNNILNPHIYCVFDLVIDAIYLNGN